MLSYRLPLMLRSRTSTIHWCTCPWTEDEDMMSSLISCVDWALHQNKKLSHYWLPISSQRSQECLSQQTFSEDSVYVHAAAAPLEKWPMVREGDGGRMVHGLQVALDRMGFNPGREDMQWWQFGDSTYGALQTMQVSMSAPWRVLL